jgi:tetratricopeptide (TPR) repeat protein
MINKFYIFDTILITITINKMKKIFRIFLLTSLITFVACNNIDNKKENTQYEQIKKQDQPQYNKKNVSLEQQKKLEELIQLLEDHPKSAKLYAERAGIFVEIEEVTQALQDITMAVDLDPDNPDYRTNRAQLLRQFKKNREALEELNKALKIDPEHLGALFNRGALYFNTNKFDKALKDFTKCIESQPDVATPYFNRAFTYEQLHDFEKAKKDLNQFLKLTNNKEWKKIAQAKLDEWTKVDYKTIVSPDEAAKMGIDTKGMGMDK